MNDQNYRDLQRLIARAVFDANFRSHLLNGSRPQAIAEFESSQPTLSSGARELILAIPPADNLETFAQGLLHWLQPLYDTQPGA
jgi:hypothetical protein